MPHGLPPSRYSHPYFSAYSRMRPRFTFLSCITYASFSASMPSGSWIAPLESDSDTTLAPSWLSFSTVYCATLPLPLTTHVLPAKDSPRVLSISCAKYTFPYPVASGRTSDPPHLSPLPVSTPVNSLASRLYCPNRNPISRPPTPMSPAGTSVCGPICRNSSVMKLWQKRMTSASLFPLGSKSDPPLPPPIGSVVSEFLKICSNPRNFRMLKFTLGWNRSPPLYGPIALLNSIRYPRLIR